MEKENEDLSSVEETKEELVQADDNEVVEEVLEESSKEEEDSTEEMAKEVETKEMEDATLIEEEPEEKTEEPVIKDENPFEETMIEEQGFAIHPETEAVIPAKKKSNKKKIIIPIVILLVLLIGGILFYKMYFNNSKRIMSKAITHFSEKVENVFDKYNSYDLGDNYTMKGDFDIDIQSDYLEAMGTTSIEMLPYANLLKNLSKTNNKFVMEYNAKGKEALIDFNSKLGTSELVDFKYFVQNDKQYMMIKGLLNQYIDMGNDTSFFDALEDNEQLEKDVRYVYEKVIESLKKNLKDEYFQTKNESVSIAGKKQDVRRITLVINNKNARELTNNILKDLKNDKKATKILTKAAPDFKDAKVDSNEELFGKTGGVYINVYVNKYSYKELMYEIEMFNDNQNIKVNYVEATKNNTDVITLLNDNKVVGSLEMKTKGDTTEFNILDSSNTSLGTLKLIKDGDKTTVTLKSNVSGMNIDMKIVSTMKKGTKDKEYTGNMVMTLNVEMQGYNLVDMKIKSDTEITQGTSIKEDTTNVVKETEIDTVKFEEYFTNALEKLMS